jgi:hypothetical protein
MTTVESLSESHADIPFEAKLAALLTTIVPPVADGPRAGADTRKSPACPAFTGGAVRRVLSKMPSQAATRIESWSPRLLPDAIDILLGIAEQLGHVCAMLLNGAFSERAMSIIRAGRAVLIPKDSGDGICPLTLSCFFAKLTGGLVFQSYFNGRASLDGQYGLGMPDGVAQLAHAVRAEREFGAAIVRIDISNAFGVCARHLIAQALNEMTEERNLQAAADVAAARATAAADRPAAAAAAPVANAANAAPERIDYAFMLKRYFNTI